MKRIVASLGALALVAVAASPAMGFSGFSRFQPRSQDTLSNWADVNTDVVVKSNTGGNHQLNAGGTAALGGGTPTYSLRSRGFGGNRSGGDAELTQVNDLISGPAAAGAVLETYANNGTGGCDCFDEVENGVDADTNVTVKANTGRNFQKNFGATFGHGDDMTVAQGNVMGTGAATSQAQVFQVFNSSYVLAD